MRRCYSTKPIEEIQAEIDQKGAEYWRFLLTKALQDKSLDVIEHFTMTLLVDGVGEVETGRLSREFPFLRFMHMGEDSWLLSMNARTLIEMWRSPASKRFASAIVSELDAKKVCPILQPLAFGEMVSAG
jgi:hypothetical protein